MSEYDYSELKRILSTATWKPVALRLFLVDYDQTDEVCKLNYLKVLGLIRVIKHVSFKDLMDFTTELRNIDFFRANIACHHIPKDIYEGVFEKELV